MEMKKLVIIVIALMFSNCIYTQNAESKFPKLPSVNVKTSDGKIINTTKISNNGKPVIISFWASWSKPSLSELSSLAKVYKDWQKETGVRLIAVAIDDARSQSNVMSIAFAKGWNYEILLDSGGTFKRAMNISMVPHTVILNGSGEIVWQHTSFADGEELKLIDLIRRLIKGEDISNP